MFSQNPIYKSPHPPIKIPDLSLADLILSRCKQHENKVALIDAVTGQAWTYHDFLNKVAAFSEYLYHKGVRKGQVVALISANSLYYPVAFHAIVQLGGVATLLNSTASSLEIKQRVQEASVEHIVCSAELEQHLLAIDTISLQFAAEKKLHVLERVVPALETTGSQAGIPTIQPESDIAVLPYSSGTSGLPKGVMLSHRNIVANILQNDVVDDGQENDMILAVLPLYHIYGMTMLINLPFYRGATVVIMPRFTPESFLSNIQHYRITKTYLVPPLITFLAQDPHVESYDLSSLRIISSGAAPLGKELTLVCQYRINCPIQQGYGLTETSPTLTRDDYLMDTVHPGSIGRPCPNTEIRLVDPDTGQDIHPAKTHMQAGELWARGPQIMMGYSKDIQATQQAFAEDRWFKTGDLALRAPNGCFYIVGRIKEMIKYNGHPIAPAEIEEHILLHPAVADVAVIGIPDLQAGEIPKAYIVLKMGHVATEEEIKLFLEHRVSPHKKIRRVEFVDKIPKTPSGKILRRLLLEKHRADTSHTKIPA